MQSEPIKKADEVFFFNLFATEWASSRREAMMAMNTNPRISPIQGSLAHELFYTPDAIAWERVPYDEIEHGMKIITPLVEEGHGFQHFVAKHDWASVFKNAEGLEQGFTALLPFPDMTFELETNGVRVLLIVSGEEGGTLEKALVSSYARIRFNPSPAIYPKDPSPFHRHPSYIKLHEEMGNHSWHYLGDLQHHGGENVSTAGAALPWMAQLRSCLLALELEVADTHTIDPPEKLNKARVRSGKVPFASYRVVDLAKKHQTPHRGAEAYKGLVRLHIRRGHLMTTHSGEKVWRKAHLVGNRDLGYIEHIYRI